MVYGLTSQGFLPKPYDVIRGEIVEDLKEIFGDNVDTTDDGPLGVLTSIYSEREADLWDLAEQVYHAAYRSGAVGAQLDDLYALIGGERTGATYSTVELSLTGTAATVVPAGSITADAAGQQWIHTEDGVIPGTVTASPADPGPIAAVAGTLTLKITPVSGWTGVTNPLDAIPGVAAQSDPQVRTAMGEAFHSGYGSSTEALWAALRRVPGVLDVTLLENRSWIEDEYGLPPKSYEAIVRGGDDDAVAEVLWLGQPEGIQSWGSTIASVVDSQGDAQTIRFTRPTEILVWMTAEVEVYPGFAEDGEDQIKATLLTHGLTQVDGQPVVPFQYVQKVELPKMRNLVIKVGTAINPTQTTPLVLTPRQRASIQTANVVVTRIN